MQFLIDKHSILHFTIEYELDKCEMYCKIAKNIIILIEESLGRFAFWGMTQEQILGYKLLSNEEYQIVREASIKSHYTKRADVWYCSLEKTLVHADTPYSIYKSILDADYKISKSFAACLIKNNFVAKLLLDPRLTSEQKHYLLGEFTATQVEKLYRKNCRKKKKLPQFGKRFQNRLAIYAQLLSSAELLFDNNVNRMNVYTRLCIYRATYILKKSIGVEILDPKPYILQDIVSENMEWIDLFLELAEWTRLSGYMKQSKQMKNKLLDCCLALDFEQLSEEQIQLILYRLTPLAHKYQRKDVVDALSTQLDIRREFCVDLLGSPIISDQDKQEIVRRFADELLCQACVYCFERTTSNVEPAHTGECMPYQDLFIQLYPQIERIFAPGQHSWVDILWAVFLPEENYKNQSMLLIQSCNNRMYSIINSNGYRCFNETDEIDGLVYMAFEKADIDCLALEGEDLIMTLSEEAGYSKNHICEIIQNIHRIRPETKAFLSIE